MLTKRQGMGRVWAGAAMGVATVVGVVAAGAGVGCSGTKDVLPEGERELAAAEMAGTWVVSTIDGAAVSGEHAPTVDIWGDGKVSGSTGVNRFSTKVTIESAAGGRVKFEPMVMTKRAGPAALMDVETKFGKAMAASNRARVKGETLVFWKDEVQTLTLRKKGN